MITVIHGDNIAQSRKYFADLRQSSQNPLTFDGSALAVSDLVQAIQGQRLFEEQKNIYIDEFFSKRKQSKETEALISYLSENGQDHSIFIWESKTLTPAQLKSFKKAELKKFDFPKILFNFLDSLLPGNARQSINLFRQTLETEEAEFVFFMMVRHIRILLAFSDAMDSDPIDEVKRLAPWQKGKIKNQSRAFGQEKLLDFYDKLFDIEKHMKTGQLSMPLSSEIDFLLLNL